MKRFTLAAAIAIASSCSAGAQDGALAVRKTDDSRVIASYGATATFDWPGVTACAKRPLPKAPPQGATMADLLIAGDAARQINLCRLLLSARDAGWKEGGARHANPWPPVPMQQFGDWR